MLAQPGVHVEKQDALLLEVLLELVVHDLTLVLGAHTREELPLGLGNPEPIPGVLDVRREVFPGLGLLLGRPDVIEDVVEVDLGDVTAPVWERARQEVLERPEPIVPHPLRLVLVLGDRRHELAREAPAGLEEVVLGRIGTVEAVLVVAADLGDDLGLALGDRHQLSTFSGMNASYPSASSVCASSDPPSATIFPSTKTWTKSGSM